MPLLRQPLSLRTEGISPFEFTGSLLIDLEKNPLGICGAGRDITERKQTEEKIKDYTENLEEKVRKGQESLRIEILNFKS